MFLLAGCRLDVDVTTSVNPDGSGEVVVTVRADEELVESVPGLVADLRVDDLADAGWSVSGPDVGADGSVSLVLRKPFATPQQATAVLAEVGPPLQVAVTQAREFALVRTEVRGTVQGVDVAAFADAELVAALGGVPLADRVTSEQLAQGFGLQLQFHLPGEVVATNGTRDGSTVAWAPALAPGAATAIEATAEVRDDGAVAARDREAWARRGLWAWGGIVLLVALVAVVWWWRRRRSRRLVGSGVR